MGGIAVEIHEPVNVLSTMILTLTGGPKGSKLHPIALAALEHTKPFRDHPSLAWLREFYRPTDFDYLYGHAAQFAGPVSFTPRSRLLPAYITSYEPARIKDLPGKMEAFYNDAKLGTFRRKFNAEYTYAAADVKDALEGARIEEFLRELYGPTRYKLVVVPVPTHPFTGGGTGAVTGWEDVAFLHPPAIAPTSTEPVSWSLNPEGTQVLAQHELSHGLHYDATRNLKDLVPRLRPVLRKIPRDSPLVRARPEPEGQFAELFIRASSVAYLRRTHGDEVAYRWMEDQITRAGTPLIKDFFLLIERYLSVRKWPDLHAFLEDLPQALQGRPAPA